MCDVVIPVLDAPMKTVPDDPIDPDTTDLLALHREVLETIRLTIANCAHPSCAACNELVPVLDRYLLAV